MGPADHPHQRAITDFKRKDLSFEEWSTLNIDLIDGIEAPRPYNMWIAGYGVWQ